MEELTEFVASLGQKPYRAKQIFHWIYNKEINLISRMTSLPVSFQTLLGRSAYISRLKLECVYESGNKDTKKYLFGLEDGHYIESVLMRYEEDLGIGRVTVCLSTQVGCRFGCKFCASGKEGFIRNLNVSEIIDQILRIQEDINSGEERVSNVVFMGMGEPLDNYENLIKAVSIITNPEGISIGAKHISVSTCGLIDKIQKLAKEKINLRLAVSLHAAEDEKRNKIIPVNKKHPLEDLMKSLRKYQAITKRKIIFEYAPIKGFNDSDEDVKNLKKLLAGINAVINIIPLNEVEGYMNKPPSVEEINKFYLKLKDKGLLAVVRKYRGRDIEAACGQLKYRYMNKGSRRIYHEHF